MSFHRKKLENNVLVVPKSQKNICGITTQCCIDFHATMYTLKDREIHLEVLVKTISRNFLVRLDLFLRLLYLV